MTTTSTQGSPELAATRRLPSLDGWRALCIISVLGAHCRKSDAFPKELDRLFWWLFDGGLGVRCFFLISGFLITWLLLKEATACGKIDLKSFYYRRFLRIFPVYGAFLLVLFILQSMTSYRQDMYIWLGNWTFTTNFSSENPWPSAHLWSLAVEEQFYLLWPGLLGFCVSAGSVRKVYVFLILAIVIAPVWRVVSFLKLFPAGLAPLFSASSFFNYCDSLAIGCVAAFAFMRLHGKVESFVFHHPLRLSVIGVLLLCLPKALGQFNSLNIVIIPLRDTAQALGLVVLVLQSLFMPGVARYRLLNHPWVMHVGVLSYSLYIWQQLFCSPASEFGLTAVWWMSFPGWLVPAFSMGILSYHCFERPLLSWRGRLRKV